MTALLWTGVGFVLCAALVHAAIGLQRPLIWTHVSFACVMVLLCAYIMGQTELYAVTDSEKLVASVRRQAGLSAGLTATMAWFTRQYTGVVIPRPIVIVFYSAIGGFLVANQVTRYGGFMDSAPRIITVKPFGEPGSSYIAGVGPLQIGWISFVGIFLLTAIAMG